MSANTLAVDAIAKTGAIRSSRDSALAGLTKYVPTESITLYVATVSAQVAIAELVPWITPKVTFWFFVCLTPLILLLLFLRQVPAHKQITVAQWPWSRMAASTIAFLVWGIAVPGNPIVPQESTAGGVVAGFAALVVSTLLNLVVPLFDPKK